MCSLSGFIVIDPDAYANNILRVKRILDSLVVNSSKRGWQGTGFFSFDTEFHYQKTIYHPEEFIFKSSQYGSAFNFWTKSLSVHTRFPTKGEVSVKNSHPFIGKKYALMHNGVVPEFNFIKFKGEKLKNMFEVDSESLLHFLEYGDRLSFLKKLPFSKYALVIMRKRDGKIYFIRRGRPLTFMYRRDYGVIFWSSTSEIMRKSFNDVDEVCNKIWTLPEDVGFKYSFKKDRVSSFDLMKSLL